jgi:hypothetical protein
MDKAVAKGLTRVDCFVHGHYLTTRQISTLETKANSASLKRCLLPLCLPLLRVHPFTLIMCGHDEGLDQNDEFMKLLPTLKSMVRNDQGWTTSCRN